MGLVGIVSLPTKVSWLLVCSHQSFASSAIFQQKKHRKRHFYEHLNKELKRRNLEKNKVIPYEPCWSFIHCYQNMSFLQLSKLFRIVHITIDNHFCTWNQFSESRCWQKLDILHREPSRRFVSFFCYYQRILHLKIPPVRKNLCRNR